MQTQTIHLRRRHGLAILLAVLHRRLRHAMAPTADDLSPHIRRDVGLPPEVHRPTHAPPRVF